MKTEKAIYLIVFISFCLSLCIGMMDYETESLIHLLTSDLGNLITLSFITAIFTMIGIGGLYLFRLVKKG